MKKLTLTAFLAMAAGNAFAGDPMRWRNTTEWDNDVWGFTKGKVYISAGMGAVNLTNTIANTIKKSIAPNWKSVTVDSRPIWFVKGEYGLGRYHGVGLTFAQTGFNVNVNIDSVTKYNVPVTGTLKYRTWSLLARYNLHFMPEKRFDMYLGLGLGFRSNKFEVVDNDPDKNWWDFNVNMKFITRKIPNSINFPTVGGDFTLGMRYHILPPIAVYAEFGIAKSIAQGGVLVRF